MRGSAPLGIKKEEQGLLAYTLKPPEVTDDRALLGRVYQRHYHKMMAVAMQILSSHAQAEDAVHETFLKLIAHMDTLRAIPEERQIYWVLTVTKNTALDLLRKEGREMPVENALMMAATPVQAEGEVRRLVELIRAMPEGYRQVLELRFLAEWSHADIAKELHLSVGAVKTRLSRGRQMLIQRMREEGYTYG